MLLLVYFFNLSKAEFYAFLFTIILILFAEMTNTAIETVVDLCTEVYHPKAKIAKDVAAGGSSSNNNKCYNSSILFVF